MNFFIYHLSLRGLGILNYENQQVSGEKNLIKLLKHKNQSLKTIFDIGAKDSPNVKELLSNFPEATIYAFEPHPKSFKKLTKNNFPKNIKLFDLAFDKKIGFYNLWDLKIDDGSSFASFHKKTITTLLNQKVISHKVKTDTLDNFAKKNKILKIDFLKIDTEGNELNILLGAKNLLKQNKITFIQFEFNSHHVFSNTFMRNIKNLLKDYKYYRLMPNGLYPLGKYNPHLWEIFAYQNVLAVKKGINL